MLHLEAAIDPLTAALIIAGVAAGAAATNQVATASTGQQLQAQLGMQQEDPLTRLLNVTTEVPEVPSLWLTMEVASPSYEIYADEIAANMQREDVAWFPCTDADWQEVDDSMILAVFSNAFLGNLGSVQLRVLFATELLTTAATVDVHSGRATVHLEHYSDPEELLFDLRANTPRVAKALEEMYHARGWREGVSLARILDRRFHLSSPNLRDLLSQIHHLCESHFRRSQDQVDQMVNVAVAVGTRQQR